MHGHVTPMLQLRSSVERYCLALEENEAASAEGLPLPFGEPALVCLRSAIVVDFHEAIDAGVDLSPLVLPDVDTLVSPTS